MNKNILGGIAGFALALALLGAGCAGPSTTQTPSPAPTPTPQGGESEPVTLAEPPAEEPSPAPEAEVTTPSPEPSLVTESAQPQPTPTPAPTPPPSSPVSSAPASVTVTFTDAGYEPKSVTIKKGTTVVFKNNSSGEMWPASAVHSAHTLYPVGGGCIGSAFDACAGMASGNSWSFKFDAVGSWKYHDHLSPGKTGTVVVEE